MGNKIVFMVKQYLRKYTAIWSFNRLDCCERRPGRRWSWAAAASRWPDERAARRNHSWGFSITRTLPC